MTPSDLLNDPALLREAAAYTQAQTGFPARLIEKDFFCSVLLAYLADSDLGLVFKGGTCLAKVHAGFYRLSEDIDFAIPAAPDSSRTDRRRMVEAIRRTTAVLSDHFAGVRLAHPLEGANNSTQYQATVGYQSRLNGREESILLEISLREEFIMPTITGAAKALMLDPISDEPLVEAVRLPCLSLLEAFAEKFRAALSRRTVAIRDFYDLDYAVRRLELPTGTSGFVELVRRKLAVPGNDSVDISEKRLLALRLQLDVELRSVLREGDFRDFNLDAAFAMVAEVGRRAM